MSSGLLSQSDFENGYRFITADLSRKASEAVDNIAKSVQVIGTNSSSFFTNLLFCGPFKYNSILCFSLILYNITKH